MRLTLLLLLGALLALPAAASGADKTTWLCNPNAKKDPCRGSLTATVLKSDGSSTTEHRKNASNPKVDCFYVYPTVSDQKTINANLKKDPEILAIAHWQASRFSERCRVWAPMYRQLTLVGIGKDDIPASAQRKAYRSMRSGWHEYLAKHNHGRGVVLIGHSQGSFLLRRLIADEIDKRPKVRNRLVSALLLGGDVTVRKGKDSGGDFDNIPACRRAAQTGCVVAYSMYGDPPPDDSKFARVRGNAAKRLEVLCTNPAAIGAGGAGLYLLQPYAASGDFPGTIGVGVRIFMGEPPDVSTPWFRPPGRYKARCAKADGASFLKVVASDGARVPTPTPDPTWGYHLGDVNLALGNLTALAGKQAVAYLRR